MTHTDGFLRIELSAPGWSENRVYSSPQLVGVDFAGEDVVLYFDDDHDGVEAERSVLSREMVVNFQAGEVEVDQPTTAQEAWAQETTIDISKKDGKVVLTINGEQPLEVTPATATSIARKIANTATDGGS